MPRRTFYSFHYQPDNWRASQVRNIGVVEGNRPCTDNEWETVCRSGDERIKRWINDQMSGRTVTIVLIGSGTANRKWIDYEIVESWNRNMGLFGIYVHNLKDSSGLQSRKGRNPFAGFNVGQKTLESLVQAYDPPYSDSRSVYQYITNNIEGWIENALVHRRSVSLA
jgi:hypothetical protein